MTGNFIDSTLVKCLLLPSQAIPPLQALNVDGTLNKQGQIVATTKVQCQAATFDDELQLMITNLGRAQVILGMPWLKQRNPQINWVNKTIEVDDEHI